MQTPLAPAAAAEIENRVAPDMAQIRRCYEQLAASNDLMLVEGAGGLAVPIAWGENYADLARALDAGFDSGGEQSAGLSQRRGALARLCDPSRRACRRIHPK